MTTPFKNAKFEATGETKQWMGVTLHRIRAAADIAALGIVAGTLGGWIEREENLQVYGDAWVYDPQHLGWFSCVGSENGTLCWFLEKDGGVRVKRGCFSGALDQFRSAVEATHGDSPHGEQYRLLVQFIELRSAEALKTFQVEDMAA